MLALQLTGIAERVGHVPVQSEDAAVIHRAARIIELLEDHGHVPHREDAVATWIKRKRDGWERGDNEWRLIDWLLDDYRLHADTGAPLSEDVVEGG